MMKIEKGVPIPSKAGSRGAGPRMKELEAFGVGDSAHLDLNTTDASRRYFRSAASMGIKVSFRAEPTGCRMWRVE